MVACTISKTYYDVGLATTTDWHFKAVTQLAGCTVTLIANTNNMLGVYPPRAVDSNPGKALALLNLLKRPEY